MVRFVTNLSKRAIQSIFLFYILYITLNKTHLTSNHLHRPTENLKTVQCIPSFPTAAYVETPSGKASTDSLVCVAAIKHRTEYLVTVLFLAPLCV